MRYSSRCLNANICGMELHILHGHHRKYPEGTERIPGHEVAGEIVEVGEQVKDYQVGERVFVAPNMGDGNSRQTISSNNNLAPNFRAIGINIDGAFAEYMRIPEDAIRQGNVMPISSNEDPAIAADRTAGLRVTRGQNAERAQRRRGGGDGAGPDRCDAYDAGQSARGCPRDRQRASRKDDGHRLSSWAPMWWLTRSRKILAAGRG